MGFEAPRLAFIVRSIRQSIIPIETEKTSIQSQLKPKSTQRLAPNDLWCADFKGEFKLGDGRNCYPLAVTDHASRFLLMCEALESTREDPTPAASASGPSR
jgi:hypothetical protein